MNVNETVTATRTVELSEEEAQLFQELLYRTGRCSLAYDLYAQFLTYGFKPNHIKFDGEIYEVKENDNG